MRWTAAVTLLLLLLSLPAREAAAQARSDAATLSSLSAPASYLLESGDSPTLQQHATDLLSLPSAGKVLKRTGIGALAGVALGAAFAGLQEVTVDHSNHEDDLIMLGASMLIGAVSGAVLGLVSSFVN
jgi:hypothetical protein